MSTLTLLRHGQAAFGAAHYDTLSPLGVRQAQAVAAHFAAQQTHFDTVLSGPRQRQQRTAELAMAELALPPLVITPALDEFADGDRILASIERRSGVPVLSDTHFPRERRLRLYSEELQSWSRGDVTIDGVRSAREFRASLANWFAALAKAEGSGRQVLAVTSAGVIAALVCEVLNLADAQIGPFMNVIGNASLTTLLWSSRGYGVQSFNETAHLAPQLRSGI